MNHYNTNWLSFTSIPAILTSTTTYAPYPSTTATLPLLPFSNPTQPPLSPLSPPPLVSRPPPFHHTQIQPPFQIPCTLNIKCNFQSLFNDCVGGPHANPHWRKRRILRHLKSRLPTNNHALKPTPITHETLLLNLISSPKASNGQRFPYPALLSPWFFWGEGVYTRNFRGLWLFPSC